MEENLRTMENILARIEAFLFHYGEPVSASKIAKSLKLKEAETAEALVALAEALRSDASRGLCLVQTNNLFQLATKPELHDVRKNIMEDEWKSELTPAGQETLSLIAYLGPVSKIMIDYIRGVNSGFIIRNLLVRGLVERAPSKTHHHSFDYFVTHDFLNHMGLSRVEDLPEYEKYRNSISAFAEQGVEVTPPVSTQETL
jgi:segregation and condensation protein B